MRIPLLLTAMFMSGIASAATPIDGWYSSAFGGFIYLPENLSVTISGNVWQASNYHWGYDAGGRFGYKDNPLRYELEVSYLKAEIDEFEINNIDQLQVRGYSNAAFFMGNVYYDFPDMVPAIAPFLSVGIGYGYLNTKLRSNGPFAYTNFGDHDNVFAYQASAGFTYNFADNYAVNMGYRYIGTTRADNLGKIFQAHIGEFGALYRFDGAQYQ